MTSPLRYRIGEQAAFELALGDITEETTDAIVNAANSYLLGGGGVDGAIHRAAGPQLLADCQKIREQRGLLAAGQAVSTPAGKLKARYVIHTVGPVWHGGTMNEPQILESCYCNCMEEAGRLKCASISFPAISTGAFGYPIHLAAPIAVRAVADLLQSPRTLLLARFVLFDARALKAYERAANELAKSNPHLTITSETTPP